MTGSLLFTSRSLAVALGLLLVLAGLGNVSALDQKPAQPGGAPAP